MTRVITIAIAHPSEAAGPIEGFNFFWAWKVNGFFPDRHCQDCFRGSIVDGFSTRTVRSGQRYAVDLGDRYDSLYVCGVAAGDVDLRGENNLHFALRPAVGMTATIRTYNGYLITARDAIQLSIPEAFPEGWQGLGIEFTRCKNFRFAVGEYGFPPRATT